MLQPKREMYRNVDILFRIRELFFGWQNLPKIQWEWEPEAWEAWLFIKKTKEAQSLEMLLDQNNNILIRYSQIPSENEFPVRLVGEASKRLQGGKLGYDLPSKQFLYYPDFILQWLDTPKPKIKRVLCNWKLSTIPSHFVCPGDLPYWDDLLRHSSMESLVALEYGLSLSFHYLPNSNLEAEISDIVLKGLSNFPMPYSEAAQNHL